MVHVNTTYVIVSFDEVTQQMIDDTAETSFDTLRHTTQGEDKIILKWKGDTPASLVGYTQYTYAEILEEIQNPEWHEIASSSSSGE